MLTRFSVTAFFGATCLAFPSLAQGPAAIAPAGPATAAAPATPQGAATSPLVGKAPPPITVAKWAKGEPLTGFEKGKVYIVDFWATWCGPCKAAIPHLTRLAHAHAGKVEVIGVSIMERQKDAQDTAYLALVQKFVDKQGDKMGYRVAIDTPDKQMYTAWFKPAGTGGIPTACIIDQKGLVAWTGIGDPTTVERIVEDVLAGTFDPKVEAERQRREEAEAKVRAEADIAAARAASKGTDEKYPGYRAAMERGDQAAALEALNVAFKANPESESGGAYQWKFMILMQRNKPEEVNAYVRDLMARFPDNGDIAGFASACIVATSEDPPRFDAQLGLEAARKSLSSAKPDSRWQQFARWRQGWAYYHTGDRAKAIESMQEALDGVRKLKDKFDFGDLAIDCEEALKTFKTAPVVANPGAPRPS